MASQAARVVDGVEPRLRHVRQGQNVGVEVTVVELSEGLPPHDVGGVDGQPAVLCAHRFSCRAVVAVLLPHRGLPHLGAAEVLEGHGQLAQDAVPRLLQLAVRPLFEKVETLLRQRIRGLRSVSFQLPCEGDVLQSAFEDKPLCVPRQLAELLQLSVEEVCADFDAMLRHDWRRLGISAEEVREFCVRRNAHPCAC